MSPEDLDQERKASAERRRKQFESLRREKPVTEPTEVRTLSRAQKLKLRDDDFGAPKESGAPFPGGIVEGVALYFSLMNG